MTIKFNCGQCGLDITVGDELAGRSGKCPKCKNPMTVPSLTAAAPGRPAPSKSRPGVQEEEDLDGGEIIEEEEDEAPPLKKSSANGKASPARKGKAVVEDEVDEVDEVEEEDEVDEVDEVEEEDDSRRSRKKKGSKTGITADPPKRSKKSKSDDDDDDDDDDDRGRTSTKKKKRADDDDDDDDDRRTSIKKKKKRDDDDDDDDDDEDDRRTALKKKKKRDDDDDDDDDKRRSSSKKKKRDDDDDDDDDDRKKKRPRRPVNTEGFGAMRVGAVLLLLLAFTPLFGMYYVRVKYSPEWEKLITSMGGDANASSTDTAMINNWRGVMIMTMSIIAAAILGGSLLFALNAKDDNVVDTMVSGAASVGAGWAGLVSLWMLGWFLQWLINIAPHNGQNVLGIVTVSVYPWFGMILAILVPIAVVVALYMGAAARDRLTWMVYGLGGGLAIGLILLLSDAKPWSKTSHASFYSSDYSERSGKF